MERGELHMNIKIIFSFLLGAAVALIWVIFNLGFEVYESMQISLSVLGLLTTFGGAYLGAKVAGESNAKISKDERRKTEERHKKKGNFIKSDFVNECNEVLKRFRNKDVKGKLILPDKEIYLVSDFKEEVYEKVDKDYLKRIDQMVNTFNDYRVSDSFFYLEDKDIKHFNSIVKELNDIFTKILFLNELIEEGISQEEEIFSKKVDELGFALVRYYKLVEE